MLVLLDSPTWNAPTGREGRGSSRVATWQCRGLDLPGGIVRLDDSEGRSGVQSIGLFVSESRNIGDLLNCSLGFGDGSSE